MSTVQIEKAIILNIHYFNQTAIPTVSSLLMMTPPLRGSFFAGIFMVTVVSTFIIIIIVTRSYAALRAADLEWIVGPGYSLGGYILEKNHEKPTWNHEKNMKNQPGTTKKHENLHRTMKNQPGTMKNHEKP